MTTFVRALARVRALTLVGVATMAGAAIIGHAGTVQASGLQTVLQQGTTVAVSPAVASVGCGETVTVDIQINSVTGLYGLDFKLSYDPAVVEVVDANAAAPGVQIQSGPFPDVTAGQGLIQVNNVDIAGGVISYAASLINPTPAVDGSGVAAQVTFRGLAAGSSPLSFVSVLLSDRQASPITVTPVDGTVRVTCTGTPRPTATRPSGTAPRPTATRPGGGPTAVPSTDKCYHVVAKGETMYGIAAQYGTTVAALQQLNGITNPNWIVAGSRLKVPCGSGPRPTTVPGATAVPGGGHPGGGHCFNYIVKMGDTLSRVAAWNNDTVYGIASRNGIANPDRIRAGQSISVCPSGGGSYPPPPTGQCKQQHYVKPGETLSGIAWMYGLSTYVLQQANGLSNPNLIYAGQTLCIP